jgi:hypothetical protein
LDKSIDITDEEKWNFLDGSTDAALNKKIQDAINSNPTFKLEMEEIRLLWNDLNSIQEHKELKKSFNQYHHEHFPIASKPIKKKSKKIWLYTLSSAACISFMFSISQLFWQNEMSTSADNAS